jgi:hypothetical protein
MPDGPPVGTAPPLPPTAPATHGAPPSPSGGINTQRQLVHRAHPQLPRPRNHPAHPHHHRPSRSALVPPRRSGSGRCTTICTRPSLTTSIQPLTLAPTHLRRNAPSCTGKRRARSPPLGPSSGPPPTSTNPSSSRSFRRRPPPPALPRVARPLRTLARRLHTRPWYCLRRTAVPRTRRRTLAARPGLRRAPLWGCPPLPPA